MNIYRYGEHIVNIEIKKRGYFKMLYNRKDKDETIMSVVEPTICIV